MRFLRRSLSGFAQASLWIGLLSGPAWAGDVYGLPFCQMIYDDLDRPTEMREAQLDYCDRAESILVEFVTSAPAYGMPSEDVYHFSMLFFAAAHWQKLAEVGGAALASCGDGTCEGNETVQQCPADCGSSGGDSTGGGEGAGL